MSSVFATADLLDAHGSSCQVCSTQLRQFGGRRAFSGKIRTIRCRDDNVLVRRALEEKVAGEVLVVDGGGSLDSALLGDMLAELGRRNGWSGIVIFGAVRDSAAIAGIDIGVKALGTNPRKSAKNGAGSAGVALEQGGAVFEPGSWLYSDDDGIVVSKQALA